MSSVTSSTSSPSSVLVVTITIAALTTTFTPPATCTEGLLTQLSSPGYQIWLNEPEPVPGTKYSACYPSQFMDGYTSIANSSSSIAPMFSPLVCPEGWITATTWTNGYIACCNSGYLLAPPSTTVDPNRPAYGGTCYSNFDLSQTVTVTAFDNVNVTATADWVASTSGAQAYGHPIDGFMADVVSTTGSSSTTITASSTIASQTLSSTASSAASNKLSGGATAGAVVGSIAGVAALASLGFFLFKRRQTKQVDRSELATSASQPPMSEYGNNAGYKGYMGHELSEHPDPNTNSTWTSSPTAGTGTSSIAGNTHADYPASPNRYELEGSQNPNELDGGYQGSELRGW